MEFLHGQQFSVLLVNFQCLQFVLFSLQQEKARKNLTVLAHRKNTSMIISPVIGLYGAAQCRHLGIVSPLRGVEEKHTCYLQYRCKLYPQSVLMIFEYKRWAFDQTFILILICNSGISFYQMRTFAIHRRKMLG